MKNFLYLFLHKSEISSFKSNNNIYKIYIQSIVLHEIMHTYRNQILAHPCLSTFVSPQFFLFFGNDLSILDLLLNLKITMQFPPNDLKIIFQISKK